MPRNGGKSMINRVYAMYFSATDTTKTICETIAEKAAQILGAEKLTYDFTNIKMRDGFPEFNESDLVVFGTPTYAGRVPNVLIKYVASVKGNGAYAVPVVLFGNRNYDDSLIELRNTLSENGFKAIAGAAFVGEHSFSRILAAGRPNEADRREAEEFSEKICAKLKDGDIKYPVYVKGEEPIRPYYQPRDRKGTSINILKVKPKVSRELCDNCGICAEVCPMGSIPKDDVFTYTGICIKCGACEKKCPNGARYYDDPGYIYHRTELEEGYPEPKENEVFL